MSRVTGEPQQWARDFALIGGTTSAVGPLMAVSFGVSGLYMAVAVVAGTATGAALGAVMPFLLDHVRGRVPLALLMALGPGVGALWGGLVGLLAGLVTGEPVLLALSLLAASITGATQFGAIWLPYTVQTVRKAQVWPVVLAAALLSPLAGLLSVLTTITLVMLLL